MESTIIFLIFCFSFAQSAILECNFVPSPPTQPFPAVYECNGRFNASQTPEKLEKLEGIHEIRKGNFDVQSLLITDDDELEQIPKTIGSFCPNLKSFTWEDSNLRIISGDDFKLLSRLTFLNLAGNKLESLESDIFMHAPRLQVIRLERNLIMHLERELLEDLGDLKSIDFTDNSCINGKASTSEEFQQIKSLFSGCPPLRMSEREICGMRKELTKKLENIDKKIAALGDDDVCDDLWVFALSPPPIRNQFASCSYRDTK